jgi:hypothetical protein
LSQLGLDLGSDVRKLRVLSGRKLADFVEESVGDKFQIVLGGLHRNVQALVRIGEAGQIPAPSRSEPTKIRYHYRFWAAFAVPPTGKARYLKSNDFTFIELMNDETPPPGYLLIPYELIPTEGIPDRDAIIERNIEQWLSSNGLEKERFLANKRSEIRRVGSPVTGGNESVLEQVIACLDSRQLQRTMLPLDVIATLLQKRRWS